MNSQKLETRRSTLLLLAGSFVTGCASQATSIPGIPGQDIDAATLAHYAEVEDNGWVIPAVRPEYLRPELQRREVDYWSPDAPGTIVVDPHTNSLFLVLENARAIRYGVAVGDEGRNFVGSATINRKAEWPGWTPTRNMIRREPELYAQFSGGVPGGLDNPLGARALYLYRNGRDTYYRIHGTSQPWSIGMSVSSGCIRLFNQDIIDLYNRVPTGTRVIVLSPAQSAARADPVVDPLGPV